MRLLRDLTLLLTENDDGTGVRFFDANGRFARSESSESFLALRSDGTLDLAPGGSAGDTQAIPFGDVTTCHFLLIESNSDLTVRFNGGVDLLELKVTPSTGRALLYWEGAFTAVELVNAGTSNATVLYVVAGV